MERSDDRAVGRQAILDSLESSARRLRECESPLYGLSSWEGVAYTAFTEWGSSVTRGLAGRTPQRENWYRIQLAHGDFRNDGPYLAVETAHVTSPEDLPTCRDLVIDLLDVAAGFDSREQVANIQPRSMTVMIDSDVATLDGVECGATFAGRTSIAGRCVTVITNNWDLQGPIELTSRPDLEKYIAGRRRRLIGG